MSYRIREATADELDEIGRLYHTVWLETQASLQPASVTAYRNKEFFVERVRRFPSPPLIAEIADKTLGFVAWADNYLGQLYVLSEGRSLGLGRTLLQAGERAIQAAGFKRAYLHCLVGNDSARRFYERCGWHHTGTVTDEAETLDGPVPVASWEMTKTFA